MVMQRALHCKGFCNPAFTKETFDIRQWDEPASCQWSTVRACKLMVTAIGDRTAAYGTQVHIMLCFEAMTAVYLLPEVDM